MTRHKFHILVLFFITSFATAQTSTPASAQPSKPAQTGSAPSTASAPPVSAAAAPSVPAESTVPEDAPVITINGVCDVNPSGTLKTAAAAKPSSATRSAGVGKASQTSAKSAPASAASSHGATSTSDCKTEITRAQFDKFIKAVFPTTPPSQARRRIAMQYVGLLTAANEGAKLGVQNEPGFPDQVNQQLAIARLQVLAQDAQRKLQAEAQNVSDAEVKNYYDQNPSAFEEVTLTRIFVPRSPTAAPAATPAAQGATSSPSPDAEAVAKDARQQLVNGTDPEKVEKSAYDQLKNTTTPPTTKFGAKRRGTLPPAHEQKIFALKPGEVSDVISDSVGFVIYRIDSRQQLPFDQVKDEVKRKITQQRMEDAQQKMASATNKTEYNDAYFGPEPTPPRPPSFGGAPPSSPPGGPPSGSAGHVSTPTPSQPSQPATSTQPPTPKK